MTARRVGRGPVWLAPDTNLWVDAGRDPVARADFQQFLRQHAGRVRLVSVVAQELAAGARMPARRREVEDAVAEFVSGGRTLAVSFAAELQVGRVLATLAEREGLDLSRLSGRFANDVRIAAACREHGAVLITRNVGDFVTIQRHLAGFRFLQPWP